MPSKTVNQGLKFGLSKESPFLGSSTGAIAHPSTKVIFGEPDKKARPYTSKVNHMLRKSLMSNKGNIKVDKSNIPSKHPFSAIMSQSMPPEKQKLITFFNSASSMKGLRQKVTQSMFYGMFNADLDYRDTKIRVPADPNR